MKIFELWKTSRQLIMFFILLLLVTITTAKDFEKHKFPTVNLKVKNNWEMDRSDVIVSIPLSHIKTKFQNLDPTKLIIRSGIEYLPFQIESSGKEKSQGELLFLVDLKSKQEKSIQISQDYETASNIKFDKRTQAILAVKTDYKLKDGYYTEGKFQNVSELELPQNHFAHDALIKFEGPGWESEKIGYRFYLDSRNRNDIFAKKINDVVLHTVGNMDLVSDSKESYTKMSDWGMDVFKVGESLGIGSIGMWSGDKVITVSNTKKVVCKIASDGIIKSGIQTFYKGWMVGSKSYDLTSNLSITAGSRLTKTLLSITGNPNNICTGFAKHSGSTFLKDEINADWGFIASYGKQSLAGDNLGIAVIYKKSNLIKITEDSLSNIVLLKPSKGNVTYYFCAASEMELNGIKSQEEFINYLNNVLLELSNPVIVEYSK